MGHSLIADPPTPHIDQPRNHPPGHSLIGGDGVPDGPGDTVVPMVAIRRVPACIALLALTVLAACGSASTTAAPGVDTEPATTSPTSAVRSDDAAEPAGPAIDGRHGSTSRPPTTVDEAPSTTGRRPIVPATTEPPPTSGPTAEPQVTTSAAATTTSAPQAAPVPTPAPVPSSAAPPVTAGPVDAGFSATNGAIDRLAATNPAVSVVVWRGGRPVVARASGTVLSGAPTTTASPMVVASVSKVVTGLAIARLAQDGRLDVEAPVDWSLLGLDPHPGWDRVTVRELLDHTSGMPTVRNAWFDEPGDCTGFLPTLLAAPPEPDRGRWRYSNGNYCALGRLVESITGEPLDVATRQLIFDPIGVPGAHLTTDGQLPGDVQYGLGDPELAAKGVARLSRLGGAGTLIVANDSLAAMLDAMTPADWATLRWPGMFVDQYGIGHTGTVDGAKACLWRMESGNTVLAATIAGTSPDSGGGLCDRLVPAIATDLGAPAPVPDRSPP